MDDTLFDCPTCHDTRDAAAALDAELTWLRKRVAGNDARIKKQMCERCPGGTTDLSGVLTEFGFWECQTCGCPTECGECGQTMTDDHECGEVPA